jgi:hypothetical protein
LISTPASAISVELAKVCPQWAMTAYPSKLPESKAGYAKVERNYYSECIVNKSIMRGNETLKELPPAAK